MFSSGWCVEQIDVWARCSNLSLSCKNRDPGSSTKGVSYCKDPWGVMRTMVWIQAWPHIDWCSGPKVAAGCWSQECMEIPTRAMQSWGSVTLTLPIAHWLCVPISWIHFSTFLSLMFMWYFCLDRALSASSFVTTCQPPSQLLSAPTPKCFRENFSPKLGETPLPLVVSKNKKCGSVGNV